MACKSCGTGGCSTGGCGSSGACSSGGCNRLNTFEWLTDIDNPLTAGNEYELVEVSFKQGSRKEIFRRPNYVRAVTGEFVAVEVQGGGYDVGHITLSGEMVRLQMKRKRIRENQQFPNVIRLANERDMERLHEARAAEREVMIKARAIARTLRLDMKIGDVEMQGDKRKATFYYTAEGRVDFRELIRQYASSFHVRIEMRQIGARQESARLGGLGPCGRELCCSTWLTDYKMVNTGAARYQNLAINQAKLSGQCGRLKCCLNYELDAYIEVFKEFPRHAERIQTISGTLELIKTDIFKRLMFYILKSKEHGAKVYTFGIAKVKEMQALNAKGIKVDQLVEAVQIPKEKPRETQSDGDFNFVDVTGEIELAPMQKKKKKKKSSSSNASRPTADATNKPTEQAGRENRPQQPKQQQQPKQNNNRPPQAPRKEGEVNPNENRSNRPPQKEGENNENRQNNNNKKQHPPRKEGDTNTNENRNNRPPQKEGENNENRQNNNNNKKQHPPRKEGEGNAENRNNRPPQKEGENNENKKQHPPRKEGEGNAENKNAANPNPNANPNRNKNNRHRDNRNKQNRPDGEKGGNNNPPPPPPPSV